MRISATNFSLFDTIPLNFNKSSFPIPNQLSVDDSSSEQVDPEWIIRDQGREILQIFNRYATYNGSSPYKTPGMMTLIQHLENHFGTFIPEGGMYEITNAIYNLAKQVGVKFHFDCNVDEIILDKNICKKIRVNNKLIESDIII